MKAKTQFVCTDCGYSSAKWYGKCPGCGAWNTMEEISVPAESDRRGTVAAAEPVKAVSLQEISTADEARIHTGFSELDRVLGGGAVCGSVVLVGGEPGIGKSTLLLQICDRMQGVKRILYISGEESVRQIRLRADRLGVKGERLKLCAETSIDRIRAVIAKEDPDFIIVDSVQTVYCPEINSAPGSVTQIRECTMQLMQIAKGEGRTVFIVGHVNKEGTIAGPKILEHMVDCVLSLEGEKFVAYRILRSAKNRFGSTDEVGVFEMLSSGLSEVENPSASLLSGRPAQVPGTCVTCIAEGTRPILSEVQALVAPTAFGNARRTAAGLDYSRLYLLLAVLEKRAGLPVGACDAYVNVVGGFRIDEPASDLAVALAVASSFRDRPIPGDIAVFGELGLTGELRAVSSLSQRIAEIARLGFRRCVMPDQQTSHLHIPEGIELIKLKNITDCIEYCIGK
ncbi:MAG: DNA repair protein RadA [Clostridia bacterium]|nr:DNA repair protein RadA [Clostridia bacterium]